MEGSASDGRKGVTLTGNAHGHLLRGPTGTKFLSLVCHTESKMEVPLTLAVVAARHPLLDGHTHQVLLCVPVKELMRSGKHSERERYPEFIPDFTVAPV